jgi:predicted CoA-binding protein
MKDKTDKLRKQLIKVGKYLDEQGYSVTIIIQPKHEENELLKKIKSSLKSLLYFCLPERLRLK